MKTQINSLALVAMMTASTAFAQSETDSTETETATETETETEAQEQTAQTGETSEEPQLGQGYLREQVGDWEVRCIRAEGEDPCQMFQLLRDRDNTPVSEVSIIRPPEGSIDLGEGRVAVALATVVVPLETWLPGLLRISVDGGAVKPYPFQFCSADGCYAQLGLTEDDVNSFKRGAAAEVAVIPAVARDQVVTVTMSLTGFTAGFDTALAPSDP